MKTWNAGWSCIPGFPFRVRTWRVGEDVLEDPGAGKLCLPKRCREVTDGQYATLNQAEWSDENIVRILQMQWRLSQFQQRTNLGGSSFEGLVVETGNRISSAKFGGNLLFM